MWHYEEGGRRHGPVDSAAAADLIARGVIRADTRVRGEGDPQDAWRAASSTALASMFGGDRASATAAADAPPAGASPTPAEASDDDRAAASVDPALFPRLWRLAAALMAAPVGIGAIAVVLLVTLNPASRASQALVLALAGLVAAAVLAEIGVLLFGLHRAWTVVQDGRARLTPGWATALMLVPLVNLVWAAWAVLGLGGELARHLHERRIPTLKVTPLLGIVWWGSTLVAFVPGLTILAGMVSLAFLLLMTRQYADAAAAIAADRRRGA